MYLRVKKPHNKVLDAMLQEGTIEITDVGTALYLSKLAKQTKAFQVTPCRGLGGRFIVSPRKPLIKDKRRSQGKHATYNILLKKWMELL